MASYLDWEAIWLLLARAVSTTSYWVSTATHPLTVRTRDCGSLLLRSTLDRCRSAMGGLMSAHLDAITRELGNATAGINQVVGKVREADQYVQRSITAAARGGFAAMAANLQAAQQQLRTVHATLNAARDHIARAAAPVAAAPKEVDADQVQTLLGPLTGHIDQALDALRQAAAQIPPTVQRIAASANRNPATGILTEARTILDAIARQAAATKDTIAAALSDAKSAQSGE